MSQVDIKDAIAQRAEATKPLAPRIKHNSDLSQKFIAEHQVSYRYPKVSEQVELLPLEISKIVRFAYNPSIIEDVGCLLMAYRYHDGDTLSTKIGIAQLEWGGGVISNRTLDIPADGQSVEDPKLFRFRGAIWICWVQSTWPEQPLTAVVKYGRLSIDRDKVDVIHQVTPPNAKPIEKNWCPIPDSEPLTFIYDEQRTITVEGSDLVGEQSCTPAHWPYGPIRGGTPPIPYQGKLLRFFHSGLDNEFDGWRRRYFLGACLMDPARPHQVEAVSARPLVFGSEVDDLRSQDRGQCLHHKPRVVFPGGAVAHDGNFLVALGINDSTCAIARIGPQHLCL